MNEFFETIINHPFVSFFLAIFIIGILDEIVEIIKAFKNKN